MGLSPCRLGAPSEFLDTSILVRLAEDPHEGHYVTVVFIDLCGILPYRYDIAPRSLFYPLGSV
jgi:hypothetical protein